MNILLIPDSFKDSLSAEKVATAMAVGIRQLDATANITTISASDGGEGFLAAVRNFVPKAKEIKVETVDPLGRPHVAVYLFDAGTGIAYIELAKASGLELLDTSERNPLKTSTYGTGLQIKHAIATGAIEIYVGLGGSATNDAGAGMAAALRYEFLDSEGNALTINGASLEGIETIHKPISVPEIPAISAVNDVRNLLYGPQGAAFTYARQKGADEKQIEQLERGLQHFAAICAAEFGEDFSLMPGTGAAGGSAFGLKVFMNAAFISGVSFMLDLAGFEQLLKEHQIDLILTGEGKIDAQTAYGKMVSGVANEAMRYKIPVAAVCGKLELDKAGIEELNLREVAQLYSPDKPASYSYDNAERLISEKTKEVVRAILL